MMGAVMRGISGRTGLSMKLQARRTCLGYCSALAVATGLASLSVAAAAASSAAPGKTSTLPSLVVLGDSLSAEYGIPRGSGWVALLEKRLAEQNLKWRVVNASVSGDTTAGGRSRLPAVLQRDKPAVVVIELGGNDALRGLPLASTRDNLRAMAQAAKAAGAKVVIVGMQMPPNYGRAYGESFAALFAEVAQAEKSSLAPFLLAGIADVPESEANFQTDRIHPLAKAHPRMLDNVWPALKPLLQRR
jgi:acyl-CoA thioesterase-1